MDLERARSIFDCLGEGLYALDRDGRLTFLNAAGERLLGWTQAELLGRDMHDVIHFQRADGTAVSADVCPLLEVISSAKVVRVEDDVFTRKDGRVFQVSYTSSPLILEGEVQGAVLAFSDISERKRMEQERGRLMERLAGMARTDELTGLPNRRAWDQELLREISRAGRREHSLAVVMLDLDFFKAFNDLHGHQAGDALLRETGAMWRLALRGSDFIARYGGEEFAVLLPDCPPEQATLVLERLLAYLPSGQTCSAGIAHWNRTESAVAMVARADQALYQAKHQGRNRAITAT